MQVVNQGLAVRLGQLSEELSNVLVSEFAQEELQVFEVLCDDLDLPDTDGTDFDELD
jgi:hypothetical protein